MFGLNPIMLYIGGGLLIITNLFTGIKVYNHVRTEYETLNLKNQIVEVTKERRVEVLDKKTLETAIAQARTRWEQQQVTKGAIDVIVRNHEESSDRMWCELNADELRLWNDENRGLVPDVAGVVSGREQAVPAVASSEGREARPAVAQ